MKRMLQDENGAYDLALVVAVNPIRTQVTSAGIVKEGITHAKIHLHGGQSFSVNMPFEEVLDAWMEVKDAEGHPSDREAFLPQGKNETGQTQ